MNPSRLNQNKGQRLSLIGAMIEDKVARGELSAEQFAADMDAYLQHPLDRSLFGLPAIKVEDVRGDGEASPEQKTIRRFYGFSALALIALLAGFVTLVLRSSHLPGISLLMLFGVVACLAVTDWVLTGAMQAVCVERRVQWAGAQRLRAAQQRIHKLLLRCTMLCGAMVLVLAAIALLGTPVAQHVVSNPQQYAMPLGELLVGVIAYIVVLTSVGYLLLPDSKAESQPGAGVVCGHE